MKVWAFPHKLDHGEVTREDLRVQARAAGIPGAQLIPEDGETLELAIHAL